MDVSIIIVNYKTRQLTEDCIDSVLKYTQGLQYEIILVENGSKDFEELPERWLKQPVSLVISKENLGFAKGNNLGLRSANGKYILLLNSDTYLVDNAIRVTFDYMERHPRAGVVSARLVFPDGRHQSVAQRFPSIRYQMIELLRLQKLLSRKQRGKALLGAFFDHKETVVADWVWGAYFMFRKEVLDKLPGNQLDDSYFMYFEDMQWCMDIRKLGYEVHYCADAEVVHIMGGSSANKDAMIAKYGDMFLRKNYSSLEGWIIRKLQQLLRA